MEPTTVPPDTKSSPPSLALALCTVPPLMLMVPFVPAMGRSIDPPVTTFAIAV
jgi:hypothetical protein